MRFSPRLVSTALALGIVAGALLPVSVSVHWPGGGDRPAREVRAQGRGGDPVSACTAAISTTITPGEVELCETAEVQVTMALTCPVALPVHLVVVIDRSQSIEPELPQVQRTARDVIEELDFDIPGTEVAVVSHGFRPKVEQDFTDSKSRALSGVNRVRYDPSDIGEDPGAAIDEAVELLEGNRETSAGGALSPIEVVLLFGDGCDPTENQCRNRAQSSASRADGKGVRVLTVCYETPRSNCRDYQAIASNPRYAYSARAAGLPEDIREFQDEGQELDFDAATFIEQLDDRVSFQGPSGEPAPAVSGNQLAFTWTEDDPDLSPGKTITASYRISGTEVGMLPVRTDASSLVLIDNLGRETEPITVAGATLDVTGPCVLETPTPTTAPATDTPAPTETPASTSTPTPTATSTATSTPSTFYALLPVTLRSVCRSDEVRTDVAVVIDASGSMLEQSDGRSKLDAAKDAAVAFVKQLRAGDQVAVVAFNAGADVVSPLGDDLGGIESAIRGIRSAQGTRIDLALARARTELTGERRRPDNNPVVVLLTDGLPSGGSGPETREEGRLTRAAGITIYTVGLGDAVDAALLTELAGAPERYFEAPTPDDLAGIYGQIAGQLPCPGGVLWPRVRGSGG